MEHPPSEFERILDKPRLLRILEVLLDGICAKDIETKHASLLQIMKLLELNIKKPIEFVSFETGGRTYDLAGLDASGVLELMQQIDENHSSENS